MGLRMRKFELNVLENQSFWFTCFVSLGYGTTDKVNNLIIQEGTANIENSTLAILWRGKEAKDPFRQF